ncbi:hypothetical protein [Mucilaginibacter celer]|uniref:Uncharacterized protein n=1 Tax=Mucilaginibacter celer TaxID=2305508 RepID=A0A494W033_9SPHI|nr:hypothetical protein [Mucilaginibacter celer]AYL96795.1 hypothetical protein HYN43_016460 [Mucilaginibacter celer]
MSESISIQPNIHCEPCKECGARPVIEQTRKGFVVVCPTDKKHFTTKPGLVNIDEWNRANKKSPVLNAPQYKNKAS